MKLVHPIKLNIFKDHKYVVPNSNFYKKSTSFAKLFKFFFLSKSRSVKQKTHSFFIIVRMSSWKNDTYATQFGLFLRCVITCGSKSNTWWLTQKKNK